MSMHPRDSTDHNDAAHASAATMPTQHALRRPPAARLTPAGERHPSTAAPLRQGCSAPEARSTPAYDLSHVWHQGALPSRWA